jgi:vancomycin resistance protein YoaR
VAARPRELGLFVDASASAQAAYNIGRQGNSFNQLSAQIQVWREGIDLAPLVVYDERMAQSYLQAIAAQVDRPVVEASLGVSGVEVVVRSGQVGRTLDVPTALAVLRAHLPTLSDGIIPLIVNETPPVILDVTAQAEIARRILSAPLTITVPDPVAGDAGPWTFEPQTLAGMLTIERVITPEGARYQVGLSSEALRVFLQGVAHGFVRAPQNARFIFNDDTKQLDMLQSAVIGRALDVETSIQLINQKAAAGEHSIALDMEYTNPVATDDATAEKLGITQLVSEHTSYFYGSSGSRIQNITTASARFHGVLVAPGETFSMASVLGDVSLDSGYAEALIIYGDRTIKGVGGGVCQVSTTLFRTAFFGGFPIVERYPHAYRVGYYEQTPSGGYDTRLAGLDATVFVPVVDFKFTNDSPNWLLMETYVNATARTLTWKFYSTSDGRSVDWYTTGPTNIVEPPDPLYEENPDLDEGEIKQIDYAAEGADVTVTRTVYRNGAVVFSDQFVTHYLPWRAVYQYGPGTEGIPTPEPTEGPTPEP